MDIDAVAGKRQLRRELLAARRALPPAERDRLARRLRDVVLGLPELAAATTVAAYVSVGGEPGTRPLLDALAGDGRAVLVPLTCADMSLDWARYAGAGSLRPAAHGLVEPTGDRLGADAVRTAQVVLVPALAVDRRGLRMGRGGGCYDRVLAASAATTFTCALVYDHEVRDAVPAEPHDRRVAAVATPSGIVRFTPAPTTP